MNISFYSTATIVTSCSLENQDGGLDATYVSGIGGNQAIFDVTEAARYRLKIDGSWSTSYNSVFIPITDDTQLDEGVLVIDSNKKIAHLIKNDCFNKDFATNSEVLTGTDETKPINSKKLEYQWDHKLATVQEALSKWTFSAAAPINLSALDASAILGTDSSKNVITKTFGAGTSNIVEIGTALGNSEAVITDASGKLKTTPIGTGSGEIATGDHEHVETYINGIENGKITGKVLYAQYQLTGSGLTKDFNLSPIKDDYQIIGIQLRVDVALGEDFSISIVDGASATVVDASVSEALNTKSNIFIHPDDGIMTAGAYLRLSTLNGNFSSSGRVTYMIYYKEFSDLSNYGV